MSAVSLSVSSTPAPLDPSELSIGFQNVAPDQMASSLQLHLSQLSAQGAISPELTNLTVMQALQLQMQNQQQPKTTDSDVGVEQALHQLQMGSVAP